MQEGSFLQHDVGAVLLSEVWFGLLAVAPL